MISFDVCVLTDMSLLTVFARGVPYLIITVTYYGFGMALPRYINKRVVTRQSALKNFLKTKKTYHKLALKIFPLKKMRHKLSLQGGVPAQK